MIHFNACPRCRGAVMDEKDEFGAYRRCVQCGWHKATGEPGPIRVVPQRYHEMRRAR